MRQCYAIVFGCSLQTHVIYRLMDDCYDLVIVCVWWATIILSPLAGWYGRKKYPKIPGVRKGMLAAVSLAVIALTAVIVFTRWSLAGFLPDALALALCCLAYTFLMCIIPVPGKVSRTILIVVGMIPAAVGVFVGTIGILGLAFAIGDARPHQQGNLNRNYSYRIAWWGGAMTDHDGADLKIFYRPTFAPFLEKEIYSKTFIDTHYQFEGLKVSLGGSDILVQCPNADGKSTETDRVSIR